MTKKTEAVEAKEVVIKNVVVKIGEREITLTIEEAKKLKDALEGIFGKEVIKETKIIQERDWYREPYIWPYTKPYITWKDEPMWHDKPYYEVTCDYKKYAINGGGTGGGGTGGGGSTFPKITNSSTMFLSIKS